MDFGEVAREVVIRCGDSQGAGTLTIRYFSPRERLRRALKVGGVCLGVLIVCACVPGAHIILVPICLIVAPILVVKVWRARSTIQAMSLRCARCQGELTTLTTQERYPIYETCLGCQRENQISLANLTA